VAKVLPKGAIQLPPEVRERLRLRPGTKLIAVAALDAVVIRRAEWCWKRRSSRGIVGG
jgi:AbrB family looped-hinge helix DNA binding protein